MTETPLGLLPPDPHVRIRPVRLSDCVALHTTCWPERTYEAIYRFVARAQQNATQGRGFGAVVVDDEDEILGFAQLTLWPRCGEISDLIVAEAYRGQGLGTALIQYLARAARDMHVDCIEIGAMMRNSRAIALYRRLGFVDDRTDLMITELGKENVLYLILRLC